jgi:hypothetical protein
MGDIVPESAQREIADLFEAWRSIDTWQESYTFLKEHATQLLSDEAIKLLDMLVDNATIANGEYEARETSDNDGEDKEHPQTTAEMDDESRRAIQ